ncbi:MAG: MBL fold metallo-hydrolase [Ruminococcaceae bacterium]|nr:MBL fold metallo-hydrolase [Oscillospiraceae bacterium]
MKRLLCLIFVLVLVCASLSSCAPEVMSEDALCRIYFLDVGQGDCTLIRTRGGDILIDAGPESAQDALCLRLKQLGIKEIALAVFTHPDEDHVGGADGVLNQISVKEVWLPVREMDNPSAARMEQTIEDSGANRKNVKAGEVLTVGDVVVATLAPLGDATNDPNDNSIVLRITCGEIGMLFMGDASVKVEKKLIETYAKGHISAQLYKVGHHGSSTSNTEDFLDIVNPTYAVICSSIDNSYGHPHGVVVERLQNIGATVLMTATDGEVVLECNKSAIWHINKKGEKQ